MRDALIAAAQSGDIGELQVVLDWNELKPDVADTVPSDIVSYWKGRSGDGEGREVLAAMLDVLEAPHAVEHSGPDIENNRLFVWPRYAQMPPTRWNGPDVVGILRLATPERLAEMRGKGRYLGWRLTIGADGTWHSFRKVD